MKDLSIIIVNYNTRDLLRSCLNSIYQETSTVELEIIVVDNASDDDSVAVLKSEFPQVIVIENSSNRGFAAANNQGIAIAKSRYILLLNSDTVLLKNAINKMILIMDQHPEIAIAGCKQYYPTLQVQPSCRSFPTSWNIFTEATFLYALFPKSKLFGHYYLSYFTYDRLKEIDVVMGSFMFIRRIVIDEIGGFDETFFFYTEETDFCYRAKLKGYRSFFIPEVEIIHYGGGSTRNLYWMFKNLHLSQYQFINKHYSGFSNISMRFWKRVGIIVRIPVYVLRALLTFDRFTLEKAKVHMQLVSNHFNKKIK